MRILMISDVYFPRVTGVSTSIQTFARELAKKGHEVILIAPEYESGTDDAFEIIRIPSRYLPIDPEDRILRPRQIRRLEADLARRRLDLIHIQTPFIAHYVGLGLAKRLGLPIVESYHTFFEEYFHHYVSFIPSRWLARAARYFSVSQCNRVDALAVPSQAMLSVLQRYGVETRAAVIPTGIDLAHFSSGDGQRFRAEHGIPADRPTLVIVSRLAHEKNIDFILRAMVRIRDAVPEALLVVAGDGPAKGHLEQRAKSLGIAESTLFTGYLDRAKALADCYCAGDAFVFASRTETQGLVLLEAMALGVPVVSTAVMGTKEVLGDGRGALIAAEDEADFAAKAIRLLREPLLRERLSREAVQHAHEWSAPALTERMLQLYAEVAGAQTEVGAAPTASASGKAR